MKQPDEPVCPACRCHGDRIDCDLEVDFWTDKVRTAVCDKYRCRVCGTAFYVPKRWLRKPKPRVNVALAADQPSEASKEQA